MLEQKLLDDILLSDLPTEVKIYRIANLLRDNNMINSSLWYAILDFKNEHFNEFEWVESEDKKYCTECPYFTDVIYEDEQWYGARCKKDGHETMPSMYAIASLHNSCPYKAESEDK